MSAPDMTSTVSDDYSLSLVLAEQLRTVRYTCPWHPDGTVPAPASGRLLDARCRVLLFPSGQMCRAQLTPMVPPYATDLGLVTEVLTAHGGAWAPEADVSGAPMVRITVPGGPPEGLRAPADGPDAVARLICQRLIAALPAEREDGHD
jgi:hypothetical protein